MKVKCNVCGNPNVIELSKPDYEYKESYCPDCSKLLAYVDVNSFNQLHWVVMDCVYNEDAGFIPVEIV